MLKTGQLIKQRLSGLFVAGGCFLALLDIERLLQGFAVAGELLALFIVILPDRLEARLVFALEEPAPEFFTGDRVVQRRAGVQTQHVRLGSVKHLRGDPGYLLMLHAAGLEGQPQFFGQEDPVIQLNFSVVGMGTGLIAIPNVLVRNVIHLTQPEQAFGELQQVSGNGFLSAHALDFMHLRGHFEVAENHHDAISAGRHKIDFMEDRLAQRRGFQHQVNQRPDTLLKRLAGG